MFSLVFLVVKHLFTQMFSIHVFAKSGDCMKQVPVAFAIMSWKRTEDYKSINFQWIKDNHHQLALKTVT